VDQIEIQTIGELFTFLTRQVAPEQSLLVSNFVVCALFLHSGGVAVSTQ